MHILISTSLPTAVGIAIGDIFQMITLGLSDISGLALYGASNVGIRIPPLSLTMFLTARLGSLLY